MWWIFPFLLFLIGLSYVEQKVRKKIKSRKASYQEVHNEAERLFNILLNANTAASDEAGSPLEFMLKLEEEAKATREKYIRLRAKYWHDEKELLQLAQDWFLYMSLLLNQVYASQLADESSKLLKLEKPKWTEKQDYKDSKVTLEELVRRFDKKLAA